MCSQRTHALLLCAEQARSPQCSWVMKKSDRKRHGNREINIVQDNAEEIPEKGICQANIGEYALIGFDQTTRPMVLESCHESEISFERSRYEKPD